MHNEKNNICPHCKEEILETDDKKVCESCGVVHHSKCWNLFRGCSTFACPNQYYEEEIVGETVVCSSCGAVISADLKFCTKCGQKVTRPEPVTVAANSGMVCSSCGSQILPGQKFCRKCGSQAPTVQATPNTNKGNVCSNCGNELKEGQKFCNVCGTKFEAAVEVKEIKEEAVKVDEFVCKTCGAPLKEGQKFCKKCGTKTDVE